MVHAALPKKLQKKVGRRTVIRRLADKGFVPQRKLSKSDLGCARSAPSVSQGFGYLGLGPNCKVCRYQLDETDHSAKSGGLHNSQVRSCPRGL